MGLKMIQIVTQEANLKVCLIYPFSLFLEYKTWYIFNTPCNRVHQNDCAKVGGIDSGCTILEDCSASEKRDIIP